MVRIPGRKILHRSRHKNVWLAVPDGNCNFSSKLGDRRISPVHRFLEVALDFRGKNGFANCTRTVSAVAGSVRAVDRRGGVRDVEGLPGGALARCLICEPFGTKAPDDMSGSTVLNTNPNPAIFDCLPIFDGNLSGNEWGIGTVQQSSRSTVVLHEREAKELVALDIIKLGSLETPSKLTN